MAAASIHMGSRVLSTPSTSASGPATPWQACGYVRGAPLLLARRRPAHRAAAGADAGGQAFRFKYVYQPGGSGLRGEDVVGLPLSERDQESRTVWELTDDEPAAPGEFWSPQGADGSVALRNPVAQRFRIKQAPLPVPVSFPGSDFWEVEILKDYSKDWPAIVRVDDGTWHFKRGFLAPLADPKLVPFMFYRGLEQVRYSVGDRAFQVLFATVYTAAHAAAFCALWASEPGLSAAIALNWALGRLSLGKWGLLLALAITGRMWMYWTFQACKLVDRGLAKIAPPIRRFFWANFLLWMIYLVLSPSHLYPIPIWPFTPGAFGPQEAFQ